MPYNKSFIDQVSSVKIKSTRIRTRDLNISDGNVNENVMSKYNFALS